MSSTSPTNVKTTKLHRVAGYENLTQRVDEVSAARNCHEGA